MYFIPMLFLFTYLFFKFWFGDNILNNLNTNIKIRLDNIYSLDFLSFFLSHTPHEPSWHHIYSAWGGGGVWGLRGLQGSAAGLVILKFGNEKKKRWRVAVWSVCLIYMRNKNQSLSLSPSSIYASCHHYLINDPMHYSKTVWTFAFLCVCLFLCVF